MIIHLLPGLHVPSQSKYKPYCIYFAYIPYRKHWLSHQLQCRTMAEDVLYNVHVTLTLLWTTDILHVCIKPSQLFKNLANDVHTYTYMQLAHIFAPIDIPCPKVSTVPGGMPACELCVLAAAFGSGSTLWKNKNKRSSFSLLLYSDTCTYMYMCGLSK